MFKKKEQFPEGTKRRLLNKIKPFFAKQFNVGEDSVSLSTKIKEDLGADSLDAIEIIMSLEEAFNIEILDEEAEKMLTIEDVVLYLAKRGLS